MRKRWMALLLLLLLAAGSAQALEAREITADCEITLRNYNANARVVKDRNYETVAVAKSRLESAIEITLPTGARCGGLYIVWADDVQPFLVQEKRANAWETVWPGDPHGFLHTYVPLDNVQGPIRIVAESASTRYLRVKELYVLGEGEAPGWVQRWQVAPEKVDLLVLSAHPDDEWIFMGGTIPTYVDRGYDVMVGYLATANTQRRSELLDGLWHGGLRCYPDMTSTLADYKTESLKDQYSRWRKNDVYAYVATLYRKYRPDVVVTHDVSGEYGHGAHRVAADAAQKAIALAADAAYKGNGDPTWEIQKLYLHLYESFGITMDWRVPLNAFGGKTALEIAAGAYAMHGSQQTTKWTVTDEGRYSCALFGLAYTTVGPDVAQNDFLENITSQ